MPKIGYRTYFVTNLFSLSTKAVSVHAVICSPGQAITEKTKTALCGGAVSVFYLNSYYLIFNTAA